MCCGEGVHFSTQHFQEWVSTVPFCKEEWAPWYSLWKAAEFSLFQRSQAPVLAGRCPPPMVGRRASQTQTAPWRRVTSTPCQTLRVTRTLSGPRYLCLTKLWVRAESSTNTPSAKLSFLSFPCKGKPNFHEGFWDKTQIQTKSNTWLISISFWKKEARAFRTFEEHYLIRFFSPCQQTFGNRSRNLSQNISHSSSSPAQLSSLVALRNGVISSLSGLIRR